MELFLEGVDIDGIGELVKNFVYSQMQGFFNGNKRYIDCCSIHIGIMMDKKAGAPITDQVDHFLFAGNDLKLVYPEREICDMEVFQSAMVDQLKIHTSDEDAEHYTIGHHPYNGSGHSRLPSGCDGMLISHDIFWCIYSASPQGNHPVTQMIRQVLLSFLKTCFRDSEEIRGLKYEKNAEQWLSDCVKKYKIDLVDTYCHVVAEAFQVDCEILNKISITTYEERECKGKLCFVDDVDKLQDIQVDTSAFFEQLTSGCEKRELSKIESTRKFLEACEENYLLVDRIGRYLCGISGQIDQTNGAITVEFHGIASWELKDCEKTVLYYERGDYFAEHMQDRVCGGVRFSVYADIEGFWDIIDAAKEARHGALVIITADAATEAERLAKANRAIKMKPFKINSENGKKLLAGMMNVDGAVLVSFEGICEAFGVILDGQAVVKGVEERGSRYNSAMNYIGGRHRIAIVASEDKSKGIVVKRGNELALLSRS